MKTLYLLVAVLLCVGLARAESDTTQGRILLTYPLPPMNLSTVLYMDEARGCAAINIVHVEKISTDTIKRLCESGRVCVMYGHSWDDRPDVSAVYHPNVSYRTCRICGKCETQKTLDWK